MARLVTTFLVAAGAVAAAPLVLGDWKLQFGYVGIYFIAVLGLNILTGYAGQISLGHGAFMAIGGYTTAILAVHYGVSDLATIPLAGLVAGIAGFLFGFPALRLTGVYLALATFALAIVVPALARYGKLEELTGGGTGLPLPRIAPSGTWLYTVSWSIAGILFVLAWLLLRGRIGRAFKAIRENEIAAVSSGISLPTYKTLAFGISAFYAGIAGSLLAIATFFIHPDVYPVGLSILLLTGLVIGGAGSLVGVVFGALFVEFVPLYASDILRKTIDAAQGLGLPVGDVDPTTSGVPFVVYGVILLLVLFVAPQGAAGVLRKLGALTKQVYSRQIHTTEPVTPSRREA